MGRVTVIALIGLSLLAVCLQEGQQVRADVGPSESECRPYIERAIHDLKSGDEAIEETSGEIIEANTADDSGGASDENATTEESDGGEATSNETIENTDVDSTETDEQATNDENSGSAEETASVDDSTANENVDDSVGDNEANSSEDDASKSEEASDDGESTETVEQADQTEEEEVAAAAQEEEQASDVADADNESNEAGEGNSGEEQQNEENTEGDQKDDASESTESTEQADTSAEDGGEESADVAGEVQESESGEASENSKEDTQDGGADESTDSTESTETSEANAEEESNEVEDESVQRVKRSLDDGVPTENDSSSDEADTEATAEEADEKAEKDDSKESVEEIEEKTTASGDASAEEEEKTADVVAGEVSPGEEESSESEPPTENGAGASEDAGSAASTETEGDNAAGETETKEEESHPEDDLLIEFEIPENLRDRSHIAEILRLDVESNDKEEAVNKVADGFLKDLKRIYENAIKPLETLYKYRDLSNRHFSDPEIFSKPLVLFMGPWSGGKSSIINYLTGNEYTMNSLRTGAEPSPAYFNILMHGDEPEVLDGTQLAADWTFSGLQKFGEGLEDRLRGLKLPNKLLEKVNIVEIPGILEVRKQVSRLFPFNDACQWFIDRADIIFLVYDPAKLDVGPETEAILDQLKGREYQTRIILNKGDRVKPEELMRVQSALIWNISPLMSSAQPPVMYTTSLWSHPYDTGAPVRLLQAQERALLRDLRGAIDKRIENKIASARRFAVRVRNHAKMVDCYLTTYYNHKSLFGNKKQISNQIIENPQNYHIYEGLSTLTNISRYDLPDPEVYRDFFRLNPLYEFKKLSETCTYFRGCPINKLDVAIAYDFPELGGKYKKLVENALLALENDSKNENVKS